MVRRVRDRRQGARRRAAGRGRPARRDVALNAFSDLSDLDPKRVWEGIHARVIAGERLSLAVVELDPGAVVAEHTHEHEQLGLCLRGSMRFRVAEETRDVAPGDTWTIPSNVPHEATAGPDGAVVIDVFAPVREDWASLAAAERRSLRWP